MRSMNLPGFFRRGGAAVVLVILAVGLAVAQGPLTAAGELPVPALDAIPQVDRHTPPSPDQARSATYFLKTRPHEVSGDAYVIVTDHEDEAFLAPLRRLAEHHSGKVLRMKDMAALGREDAARDELEEQLRAAKPRYVAIAPRLASFHENTLLGLWEVLAALDSDPQIDAFPGLLVAPDAKALAALVDRSIKYRPPKQADVRPFVTAQVMDSSVFGMRSLQKARIMKELFERYGCSTSSLVTRTFRAGQGANQRGQAGERGQAPFSAVGGIGSAAPTGPKKEPAPTTSTGPKKEPVAGGAGDGAEQWDVSATAPRQFISTMPAGAKRAMDRASLVIFYGHGVPGMTCGLDVGAFHEVNMADKVVLCGSCFSVPAEKPDFPAMGRAPDGSEVRAEAESFGLRAVENGSIAVYGHMRLNSGFPNLYPVLRAWIDGATVGEAYQRQLNALADMTGLPADQFVLEDTRDMRAAVRRNPLLCIVIGDPALRPMAMKAVSGTR